MYVTDEQLPIEAAVAVGVNCCNAATSLRRKLMTELPSFLIPVCYFNRPSSSQEQRERTNGNKNKSSKTCKALANFIFF